MRTFTKILLAIALLAAPLTTLADDVVQLSVDSPSATQNFDSMWDGTDATLAMPDGWRVDRNLTAPRTVGSYADAQTTLMYSGGTSLASNAKNGTWNFGSSADPSDRAVGGLSTTVSGGTRCLSVMTRLHNSADVAIEKIALSYDIEKYREGSNTQGFAVQLYYSTDGTSWVNAGDDFRTFFDPDAQTLGAEVVPISTTNVSDAALRLNVEAGSDLYLAWNISVAGGSSPNLAMGLAIDNVTVNATFSGEQNLCCIYAEDVTKWSSLLLSANNGEPLAPAGTAIVGNVTYKYFELPGIDGSTYSLLFTDGGSRTVSGPTVESTGNHYLCVTATEATVIDDPDNYSGYVDPTRPPFVASGIYLRGEVNSWNADADWQFSNEGNGVYTLYDKTISGAFKVADASWSNACNYGSNGSTIAMDSPYALVAGTNDNISCGSNTYACTRIVLTITDGNASLLLESNDDPSQLQAIYIIGDNNGWDYMDTSGMLSLTETAGVFSGQVTMRGGSDGLCHWRLYQRLGMGGVWGAPDGTDNNTPALSGTLEKGSNAIVTANPATYIATFNINNGQYTLEQVASQPDKLLLQPENVVLVPTLPESVKVLSLNNSLIFYNDQDVMFNNIAQAMGKDARWTKHSLLGKSLATHYNEGDGLAEDGTKSAKMLVRSDAWSHIILQEQSALPRTDIESFRNNVKLWIDYIRDYCPNPNAVIIVPINWAYSGDWANFTEFNHTFEANYQAVARELGVTLCPVGNAYQDVYEREGADVAATWYIDDRHPTPRATYMAACMEYGLIFGEDPTLITWAPDDVDNAAHMRQYAARNLRAFTNIVDHNAAQVHYSAELLDQFGLPVQGSTVTLTTDGGGTINADGLFNANGTNGLFTITATNGADFTSTASLTVADAVTEVTIFPAIELNTNVLSADENFNSMGNNDEAELPQAWRIDRQTNAPRTVGRYDQADTHTMYAGGVNLPSNAKNGTWNFGDNNGIDRAPGGISTGVAGGTRCVNVYTHILNTGKKNLEPLTVSYNVEKYRQGNNSAGFDVQLYYSVDGRNWTSAGNDFLTHFDADSQTAGYDQVPAESVAVSGTLPIPTYAGCDIFLAWNISVASGTAAQGAMALAIDDVNLQTAVPPVPTAQHYIYADDHTGWEWLGLYAWGDSELFGAWPGESPVDEVTINGITYKKFLLDTNSGNYKLIFNNWNNMRQLPDYDITANRDYYFLLTEEDGAVEVDPEQHTAVGPVAHNVKTLLFHNGVLSANGTITVYDLSGRTVARGNATVATDNLPGGIYIARTDNAEALKFIK